MNNQTDWSTNCEECKHAIWNYELIHAGGRMAHRDWFVSGCKLKEDPYDCNGYEVKRDDNERMD